MANGTIVDQATYYHDSTTYTGTSGSATNKWVIEDIQDLLNLYNDNHSYYYEIVNDLDFNDSIYKTGLPNSSINIISQETHIYGNNHSIRNIIIPNNYNGSFILNSSGGNVKYVVLHDINFENIIHIGNSTHNCIFRNNFTRL